MRLRLNEKTSERIKGFFFDIAFLGNIPHYDSIHFRWQQVLEFRRKREGFY